MANKNLKSVNTRPGTSATPQSQKATKGQVKNNAGGFTFKVSKLDQAKRFLILGSDGGYYSSGAKLTKQNADNLIKVIQGGESQALVDAIVEVSTGGRAAKQDAGLFALAVASSYGTDAEKRYALDQLSKVARTGTSLFTFITYVQQFRGWGRALSRAVAAWYSEKTADQMAFQAVKYRQRDGWTHRDVLRKSHPTKTVTVPGTDNPENLVEVRDQEFAAVAAWIVQGESSDQLPKIVQGFEKAKTAKVSDLPEIIREYRLTWEMLPTSALKEKEVWNALLDGNVPLGALIRQLPRLTNLGIISPLGGRTQEIVTRLTDPETLSKARIHPVNLLMSMKTYESGKSRRGEGTWTPNSRIVEALEKAFYASFKYVEAAGKRTLIGLDVSGSMGWGSISESTGLTPREVTAAISLVLMATEPETHVIGFTGGGYRSSYYADRTPTANLVSVLDIRPSQKLTTVVNKIANLPFGATDCSLPMVYAMEKGLEVDTFIVMTDNETWAGRIHPHEALNQYRRKTGIDAKLIVLATEASKFSIANPDDPGMLDIAGFDSAVPQLISSFSRGL